MKSLEGYIVTRGGPEANYPKLIEHHKAKLPSAESFYWLGVAYNDFYKDTKKALDYFMKSAMMTHDYNKFHEIYYKKEIERPVHENGLTN